MQRISLHTHLLLSILAVFFIAAPFGHPAMGNEPPSVCDQYRTMVLSQFEKLPSTLEAIDQLPMSEARIVFTALTPEDKSTIWAEHLSQYLDNHPDLTIRQVSVINQAMELAQGLAFEIDRDDVVWGTWLDEEVKVLERKLNTVFDRDEAREIFATLGHSPAGNTTGTRYFIQTEEITTTGIECSCSEQSDYCSDGYGCSEYDCDADGGCGTLWLYECDGGCFDAEPD